VVFFFFVVVVVVALFLCDPGPRLVGIREGFVLIPGIACDSEVDLLPLLYVCCQRGS
jgi:hypothetical protein